MILFVWVSAFRRKNLTNAVRYCLEMFCFLCFPSFVSFTGSHTEADPFVLLNRVALTFAVVL